MEEAPEYPLSKEDATHIALANGFQLGTGGYFVHEKIYMAAASSTGTGNAWFFEDEAFKKEGDNCPATTTARRIIIEINAHNATVAVQQKCFLVIFD